MCINSENDAASRDATMAFRERRKLKGKKLYSEYAVKETMVVSYKDEDNMELVKRLRYEAPFSYNIRWYGGDEAQNVDCGGGQRAKA